MWVRMLGRGDIASCTLKMVVWDGIRVAKPNTIPRMPPSLGDKVQLYLRDAIA